MDFTSNHGRYRFFRMMLSLKNSPGTFHRFFDVILATVQWKHALVYLYDVILFSKNPEERINY